VDLSGADLDSVTRTILAEVGQNATPASMAAIASVIRNRLTAGGYGRTPSEVVHAPYQFTPWKSGNQGMPPVASAATAGPPLASAAPQPQVSAQQPPIAGLLAQFNAPVVFVSLASAMSRYSALCLCT
jgi:spore germination cell wall hydrolase CwlJ-like protein